MFTPELEDVVLTIPELSSSSSSSREGHRATHAIDHKLGHRFDRRENLHFRKLHEGDADAGKAGDGEKAVGAPAKRQGAHGALRVHVRVRVVLGKKRYRFQQADLHRARQPGRACRRCCVRREDELVTAKAGAVADRQKAGRGGQRGTENRGRLRKNLGPDAKRENRREGREFDDGRRRGFSRTRAAQMGRRTLRAVGPFRCL
jgi:hypothetical protein